jgi:hypothetical protein
MKLKNRLRNGQVLSLVGMLICLSFAFTFPAKQNSNITATVTKSVSGEKSRSAVDEKMGLYDSLELSTKGLSRQAFEYALTGYNNLLNEGKIVKNNILSILDFSLPSGKKRLFVIDLEAGQLVYNTYAAHGRNSGTDMATQFSNPTALRAVLDFMLPVIRIPANMANHYV